MNSFTFRTAELDDVRLNGKPDLYPYYKYVQHVYFKNSLDCYLFFVWKTKSRSWAAHCPTRCSHCWLHPATLTAGGAAWGFQINFLWPIVTKVAHKCIWSDFEVCYFIYLFCKMSCFPYSQPSYIAIDSYLVPYRKSRYKKLEIKPNQIIRIALYRNHDKIKFYINQTGFFRITYIPI